MQIQLLLAMVLINILINNYFNNENIEIQLPNQNAGKDKSDDF